jgi:hypothetical protein
LRIRLARDVVIFPPKGFGGFFVEADIAQDLASEIVNGSEDATDDHVALQLGKSDLDLVQPRRVGRREVKLDTRVVVEKLLNVGSFAGR